MGTISNGENNNNNNNNNNDDRQSPLRLRRINNHHLQQQSQQQQQQQQQQNLVLHKEKQLDPMDVGKNETNEQVQGVISSSIITTFSRKLFRFFRLQTARPPRQRYEKKESSLSFLLLKSKPSSKFSTLITIIIIIIIFVIFGICCFVVRLLLKVVADNNNNNNHNHNNNNLSSSHNTPPPRVLLGIFTTDDPIESQRRNVIRETYLSYYYDNNTRQYRNNNEKRSDNNNSKFRHHRICSLQDFLLYDNNNKIRNDCQLLYTFVLGKNITTEGSNSSNNNIYHNNDSNSKDDTEIMTRYDLVEPYLEGKITSLHELGSYNNNHYQNNNSNNNNNNQVPSSSSSSSLLKHTEIKNEIENKLNDIVVLNINENMNHGKSESWFLFATQLWKYHMNMMTQQQQQQQEISSSSSSSSRNKKQVLPIIDYIAKCDSDTMIYPDIFVEELLSKLPTYPFNKYYAGSRYSTTKRPGRYYIAGGCYMMSWDIANYIVSNECPRKQLYLGTEDKSIGNYIWSYDTSKIQTINVLGTIPRERRRRNDGHRRQRLGRGNDVGGGDGDEDMVPKEWMAHGIKDPKQFQENWNKRYLSTN